MQVDSKIGASMSITIYVLEQRTGGHALAYINTFLFLVLMLAIDQMSLNCSGIVCIFICLFILLFFQKLSFLILSRISLPRCFLLHVHVFPHCLRSSSILPLLQFAAVCCCRLLCARLRACRPPSMCCCDFSCLCGVAFFECFLKLRMVLLSCGEWFTGRCSDFFSHCASCVLSVVQVDSEIDAFFHLLTNS